MLSNKRMSQAQQDQLFCVTQLRSTECQCGSKKQRGMAFCYRCWMQLPEDARRGLYSKVGNGFEAAYNAAWLLADEPHADEPEPVDMRWGKRL